MSVSDAGLVRASDKRPKVMGSVPDCRFDRRGRICAFPPEHYSHPSLLPRRVAQRPPMGTCVMLVRLLEDDDIN
jgi:hypothetical protein